MFSNPLVLSSLTSLAKKTLTTRSNDVVAMVNDALLFTSLVPAQEDRHRQQRTFGVTSVFDRRAIETMSLDRLTKLLQDVKMAASVTGDVFADANR